MFHGELCGLLRSDLGSRLCSGNTFQMAADLFGDIDRNRTGVRLFLCYAKTLQKVNDRFCLDLQLSGQLVNSDLGWVTHTSLRTFLFLLTLGNFLLR